MHKSHIEKLINKEQFDFLVQCPVCGENLDPKVSTKLFLTFEMSESNFDALPIDPVKDFDRYECKCQRMMKVMGAKDFDIGPCTCKRE